MAIPQPEHRRVKISTNVGSKPSTKLEQLAVSHPFTRQVDILFPSSDALESALSKISARYARGKVKLAHLVDSSGAFVDFFSQPQQCFTMLSADPHSHDVWCIDPRGLLTLLVEKDTYERLGLLGKRLPFKAHKDYFVIRLPLQKNAESVTNQARRNAALKAWDARRESEGLGAWNVVYCSNDSSLLETTLAESQVCQITCQVTRSNDVHIPTQSLRQRPVVSQTGRSTTSDRQTPTSYDDDIEDWDIEMATLFEWVGMLSLGSQRLRANDRVDPYAALYHYPFPSYIGNVTHLRWSGFIGSAFLQSVIELALASVKKKTAYDILEAKPFVAITAHTCVSSPVSYIPYSTTSLENVPVRLARVDGEDTWSLFTTPGADSQSIEWAMVESLGQYDTRWG